VSLILDALKRSEQERASNTHNPAIAIDIAEDNKKIGKRFPWTGLLVLLFLIAIAISFYWFKTNQSNVLTDSKKQSTEQVINDIQSEPELVAKTTDKNSENLLPEQPQDEAVIIPPPPLATQAKLPVKKPARPLAQQIQKKVTPQKPSNIETKPTLTPEPEAQKAVTNEGTNQTKESIPSLQDISDSEQSKLSGYEINTHFYSDKPGKSFALINMKKYRDGDLIEGSQNRIEQITTEGIVINYGQGRVLLRSH